MAYTLNDFFRPLRLLFRLNGSIVGLLLGLLLMIMPRAFVSAGGLGEVGPTWPLRMAGAVLIGFGILLLFASRERIISMPVLIATTVTSALLALVFLLMYLEREYVQPTLISTIFLVLIFTLCLMGAVMPLRYIRADYPQI